MTENMQVDKYSVGDDRTERHRYYKQEEEEQQEQQQQQQQQQHHHHHHEYHTSKHRQRHRDYPKEESREKSQRSRHVHDHDNSLRSKEDNKYSETNVSKYTLLPFKRNGLAIDVFATLNAIDQLSFQPYSDTSSTTQAISTVNYTTVTSNTVNNKSVYDNNKANNLRLHPFDDQHKIKESSETNTTTSQLKENGEIYEKELNRGHEHHALRPHPYESNNNEDNVSMNTINIDNNHNYAQYHHKSEENNEIHEPILLPGHEMHFGQVTRNYYYQPSIARQVNANTPSLQFLRKADNGVFNTNDVKESIVPMSVLSSERKLRARSGSCKRASSQPRALTSFHDNFMEHKNRNYSSINTKNNNFTKSKERNMIGAKYSSSSSSMWPKTRNQIKDRRLRRIKAYDQYLKEMNKRKQGEHEQLIQQEHLQEEKMLPDDIATEQWNSSNKDEIQSTHSSQEDEVVHLQQNADGHVNSASNAGSVGYKKPSTLTKIESTQLRNSTTAKLLDLYDEVEELYTFRANMSNQVHTAMCLDPRLTRNVNNNKSNGISIDNNNTICLAAKPTDEQHSALSSVIREIESLYKATIELVSTYLTPEEKRYLGLNSHHFQTDKERQTKYQYAPANLHTTSDKKPTTRTATTTTTEKNTNDLTSISKAMEPITKSSSSSTAATAATAAAAAHRLLQVNSLKGNEGQTSQNNRTKLMPEQKNSVRVTQNNKEMPKPQFQKNGTQALESFTINKTSSESRNVTFDIPQDNILDEKQDNNVNAVETRENIFTSHVDTATTNGYSSGGGIGNINTNYLKSFEDAMASKYVNTNDEHSSSNIVKTNNINDNNNNNYDNNHDNNINNINDNNNAKHLTNNSTTLTSQNVSPNTILPLVTARNVISDDTETSAVTCSTHENVNKQLLSDRSNDGSWKHYIGATEHADDNINRKDNNAAENDNVHSVLPSSVSMEKKPSAPSPEEDTQLPKHHSNPNTRSRFQSLLIDSDSDSSLE